MVWFILSKPNEYVIIFYQNTPPPLAGAQPWGVVTSHKNFFFFLTQSVKFIYFSSVLHIYSYSFVCNLSRLFTLWSYPCY